MKELLRKLYSQRHLSGQDFVEYGLDLLEPIQNEKIVSVERVACDYYCIEPRLLRLKCKRRVFTKTKKIIWYLIRKIHKNNVSFREIARYYNTDAANIQSGINRLSDWLDVEPELMEEIEAIKDRINNEKK